MTENVRYFKNGDIDFDSDDDTGPPMPPVSAYEAENETQGGPLASGHGQPLFEPASLWAGRTPPPRDWLVNNLIPGRQVTLLSGDGATGKSVLALQLGLAAATCTTWIGHQVECGPALFLSAEDDTDELHRRIDAICAAERIDMADLGEFHVRSLASEDALLAVPSRSRATLEPTALYGRLDAEMGRLSPALLVLDTLADLHGGDEINRGHARRFIALLRHLAQRHDCAVLVLAHPSISGLASGTGTSGSTGWNNSVRSRLYLERVISDGQEPDADLRRLTAKKSNYSRAGAEIAVRFTEGRFVPVGGGSRTLDRLSADAKAERVFMRLLREFTAEGRDVREKTGHGYAPNEFAKSGRAEGVSKVALHRAMESLFEKGTIRIEEEGPKSRRTRRMVEVSK